MRFLEEFLLCLRWRPAQAIEAAYWRMTRRRVRARTCLRRDIGTAPYVYGLWIERVEKASSALPGPDMDKLGFRPKISVTLTDISSVDPSAIEASLLSINQQSYPEWELLVPAEARDRLPQRFIGQTSIRFVSGKQPELARAVTQANGRYILRLRAGYRLPADALALYVSELQQASAPTILYGDQDEIAKSGERQKPWLKPEWNSEMFLAQDYLSDACLIETELAKSAAEADPTAPRTTPYSLLLTATAITDRPIRHIPRIVCHADPTLAKPDDGDQINAVQAYLQPAGATVTKGPFDTVRVHWPLPATPPLVSMVVPTRDKLELLRPCIASVLDKTSYPSFEVIIVDNQSILQETKDYFREIGNRENVSILEYNHEYNYASINNFAVQQSSGDLICLLNNDTEVINNEWLEELVRYAIKPEIGAAGAMLLYDDLTIQHAGIVIGMGEAAGHAHRYLKQVEPGYFCQAHIPHLVSAVTAACLVVERRKFDAVSGLDDVGFSTAFNDVDFCLKLEKAGWRNVYVPQAMLYHYESKSRGSDLAPANVERYWRELALLQQRWGTKTYVDPLHHPLLDRSFETYTLDLGK